MYMMHTRTMYMYSVVRMHTVRNGVLPAAGTAARIMPHAAACRSIAEVCKLPFAEALDQTFGGRKEEQTVFVRPVMHVWFEESAYTYDSGAGVAVLPVSGCR